MKLRNQPLRSKLRFVILVTCTAALLAACAALFAIQFYLFKKDLTRDINSIGELMANSCSVPADYRHRPRAKQLLGGFTAKRVILGAQIRIIPDERDFNKAQDDQEHDDKVEEMEDPTDPLRLATYGTVDYDFRAHEHPPSAQVERAGKNWIFLEPIYREGKHLGTIFIVVDYATLADGLIRLYAVVLCGVLALSVLVAFLLSTRLARVVTDPIGSLATTARRIAGSNDYTVRAEKTSEDEVGSFTESFNQMIERIQQRDDKLRHEIAERERAEKELQTLHIQLLDASRQAGMAEVATGVLHNVGNVLNSVNVSVNLVTEKLNIHRLNNLVRTAEMLRDKNGDLGDFLNTDPKGKLIPGYLAELSKHLVAERQQALTELELLTKNIEHIKEIVSVQQNYARVAGLTEETTAEALVEDALRMTTGSLQRHHIDVTRDYSPCPGITVERHKILQILVNLIRNAKHALDDASPASKQLALRIQKSAEGFVVITIEDNGIGIAQENLTKVFSHGFTTRKDGHGFGLHSAALAAQQMGGRLTAHSPGIRRGATFTLEIPFSRKEVAA